MEKNKKDTNNFIESITSNDLYIIKDANGKVLEKSSILDENNIQTISEEEYLSSEDLSSIHSENVYRINNEYYMVSFINLINNTNMTIYKNVSNMINRIEELEKARYTDGLTGLLNYQYFKIKLGPFTRENKGKIVLVMMDIDNFKNINDTKGHHYGNKVLINFSKILESTFKDDDLVCKYGGDEFIVAVKGEDINEVMNRLEKLRTAAVNSSAHISISCGVTEWNKDILHEKDTILTSADIKKLNEGEKEQVIFKHNINNADEALYYSKIIAGKGCSTVYSTQIKNKLLKVVDEKNILEEI